MHDLEEVVGIAHKIWGHCDGVEIHEQISKLYAPSQDVAGVLLFRIVSAQLFKFVLANGPRVELILKLNANLTRRVRGIRAEAEHAARRGAIFHSGTLRSTLCFELVLHGSKACRSAKLGHLVMRIDYVISAHEVLLTVSRAIGHRRLEHRLIVTERLHAQTLIVQLLNCLLAKQELMITRRGYLFSTSPRVELLSRLRRQHVLRKKCRSQFIDGDLHIE